MWRTIFCHKIYNVARGKLQIFWKYKIIKITETLLLLVDVIIALAIHNHNSFPSDSNALFSLRCDPRKVKDREFFAEWLRAKTESKEAEKGQGNRSEGSRGKGSDEWLDREDLRRAHGSLW